VLVSAEELDARRVKMEARERPYKPVNRERKVSLALRQFAMLATSADKGAVRDPSKLEDI
jgi:dihydroxy-acid dehydratase